MDGKLLALSGSPVTIGCTGSERRLVSRLADLVDVPVGDRLVAAGSRRAGCFLLLSGSTATVDRDGLLTSSPGAFVGLAETITDAPSAGDTVALSAVTALAFTGAALDTAVAAVEPVRRAALIQLAARRSPAAVRTTSTAATERCPRCAR